MRKVWEYGSMGVWEYGSMGDGSMGVWEYGSMGVCNFDTQINL